MNRNNENICSLIRLHWLYYIFDSLKKDKLIEVIYDSLKITKSSESFVRKPDLTGYTKV